MLIVTPELLEDVKAELYITWTDEDVHITTIIKRGMTRLNELTGTILDYEDYQNRDLLLNFCRYVRNGASEYFIPNYQDEILMLQLKEAVKKQEADKGGV